VTTAEIALDQTETQESERETEPRILEHSYDDIREYDNPLPTWWSSLFIGSIVFAGFYLLYFHVVHWGATPDDKYKAALAGYDDKRDVRERAELAHVNEGLLAQKVGDDKIIARGAKVFADRCASCHGAQGNGLIGPNLTDEYQKHGTTRLDVYKTIRSGVPGTAMLAWGDQLAPADVIAAAAFAVTLRGQKIPGKLPEGLPVGAFSK
jgi:cytochrome c oxidase cbb3-type subunit III